MSGGSYNYLYLKDLDNLLHTPDLKDMENRLRELDASDAAEATGRVLEDGQLEVLRPLWKAVEMYDSNDWGLHQVKRAISDYRMKTRHKDRRSGRSE